MAPVIGASNLKWLKSKLSHIYLKRIKIKFIDQVVCSTDIFFFGKFGKTKKIDLKLKTLVASGI